VCQCELFLQRGWKRISGTGEIKVSKMIEVTLPVPWMAMSCFLAAHAFCTFEFAVLTRQHPGTKAGIDVAALDGLGPLALVMLSVFKNLRRCAATMSEIASAYSS